MTKPKKAPAPPSTSRAGREPMTLGPDNRELPPATAEKGKEKVLDAYASALESSDTHQAAIGNLAEQIQGGKTTKDRVEALMRLMHGDSRFEIFSKGGLHHVKLVGTSAPKAEKKSTAFMQGFKAHGEKLDLLDNPHNDEPKESGDWEDGWMAAENGQPAKKYEEAKPKDFPVDVEKESEEEEEPGHDMDTDADDLPEDDVLGDDESGGDATAQAEVIQHPAAKATGKDAAAGETEAPSSKSLGEMIADAKAKEAAPKFTGKARIDFPHQIGTWVHVLTDGQNPKPAWIKNIHTAASGKTWYSLVNAGGQIDDIGAERIQQMPEELLKDYATVGELERLRALVDAHQRFKDHGEELSKQYYDLLAEEHGIAEELKAKRKEIEKMTERMAEHGRGDVQMDWRDGTAEAVAAVQTLQVTAKPTPAPIELEAPTPAKEAIDAASLGLEREAVLNTRLHTALRTARETGKTAKATVVEIAKQGPFVMVTFDGEVAAMRPLYTLPEWKEECQAIYGDPTEEYVEAPERRLQNGGPSFGFIVRVGRKTFVVGPQDEEILVRLPAHPDEFNDEQLA